jgi:hypothetical protein
MGYQKRRFFADFNFIDAGSKKCYRQKTKRKIQKLKICIVFCLLLFLKHFLRPFQRIRNPHEILRFSIAHTNVDEKKLCHISKMDKNVDYMLKNGKMVNFHSFCQQPSFSV